MSSSINPKNNVDEDPVKRYEEVLNVLIHMKEKVKEAIESSKGQSSEYYCKKNENDVKLLEYLENIVLKEIDTLRKVLPPHVRMMSPWNTITNLAFYIAKSWILKIIIIIIISTFLPIFVMLAFSLC